MEKKKCFTCKKEKLLNEFFKKSESKDGKEPYCKECRKTYVRKTQKKAQKLYYQRNREKIIRKNRDYELKNIEKSREIHRDYMKKRRREPEWKLKESLRSLINYYLKENKNKKSVEYLGCTIEFYKEYLESLFTPEMSWDNYGKDKYWEIDHIIPLSKGGSFYYLNTRPLTISENRKKSNCL